MSVATVPLRHAAQVLVSNVDKKSAEGDQSVRLVNYTDVYYKTDIVPDLDLMVATATDEQIRKFRVLQGDTIITKDSETPDDIAVPAYVAEADEDMVCGYHLALLRPTSSIFPRFLFWSMASDFLREQMSVRANGMTRYGLTYEAIQGARVPMPPVEEQRRIADFLDDQVTRIDAALRVREGLRQRANSELDAVWDLLAAEAGRLGDLIPLRRVLRSICDGPFGSSLTSSHYVDEGTRVIRLGNIGVDAFKGQGEAFIDNEYARELSNHAVSPGDLLMAGLGDESWPLGRCTVAPEDLGPAIVKADCYRIRLDSRVSHRFAAWYLSSPPARSEFRLLARGSTRARLNTEVARGATLPLVPEQDQSRIVDAFASARTHAEQVEVGQMRLCDLLQDYKRSLITAAVTGELDVTTARQGVPA